MSSSNLTTSGEGKENVEEEKNKGQSGKGKDAGKEAEADKLDPGAIFR